MRRCEDGRAVGWPLSPAPDRCEDTPRRAVCLELLFPRRAYQSAGRTGGEEIVDNKKEEDAEDAEDEEGLSE